MLGVNFEATQGGGAARSAAHIDKGKELKAGRAGLGYADVAIAFDLKSVLQPVGQRKPVFVHRGRHRYSHQDYRQKHDCQKQVSFHLTTNFGF